MTVKQREGLLWRWWGSHVAILEAVTVLRRFGTFSGRVHTPRRAFHQTGKRMP